MWISRLRPIVGCLALAGCFSTEAFATTYYVRTSGNDNRAGTSAANAWRTIQKAADSVSAGDFVYVGAGTYGEQVRMRRGGSPGNPVRFVADTSGAMTGDAGAVEIRRNSRTAVTVSADFVELAGFRVYGSRVGVSWSNASGGLIQDCEVDNNSRQGVSMLFSGADLTIVHCDIHDNARQGVYLLFGPSVTVSQSKVQNNRRSGIEATFGSGTAVSLSACSINGNRNDGLRMDRGIGNVRNCLIYDNGDTGVNMDTTSGGKTMTIWNSTIASNGDYGVRQDQGDLSITNSIVAHNHTFGLSSGGGTTTHTYNLLFGNTNGEYDGVTAEPTELAVDPQFLNLALYDYHVASTSPAIDSGTDATGIVDEDIEGNARPLNSVWDLGCYETPGSGAQGGWRILKWVEIDKPAP